MGVTMQSCRTLRATLCAVGAISLALPLGGIGQELEAASVTIYDQDHSDAFLPQGRDRYFPFEPGADGDFRESWYGNQLAAMREPVLQRIQPTDARNTYVMRVLFLPSFHPAYAVRIDARTTRPIVRMTTLTGAGGYEPGRVATTRTQTIRRDLANTIAALNRAAAIDSQQVHARGGFQDENGDLVVCADGMYVVVELVDENGYHLFARHECSLSGRLRDAVIAAATIAAPLPEHIRRYL